MNQAPLFENVTHWLNKPLLTLGDNALSLYSVIMVGMIVCVAWLLGYIIRRLLHKHLEVHDTDMGGRLYVAGRISTYLIYTIAFFMMLSALGINTSQLAVVLGALSVGIGFGLQSIVNNFISGIIILFERNLKVGDYLQLDSGLIGRVKEINIRSTRINTTDNLDIMVPNSEFVSGRVINWTLQDSTRRIHVPFGVAYGTDKDKVKAAVLEAAHRVAITLKGPGREPDVWLVGFGDSSLDFALVVWIGPPRSMGPKAIMAKYTWEIHTSLIEAGIEIPFPQRDLHLRTVTEGILPQPPAAV